MNHLNVHKCGFASSDRKMDHHLTSRLEAFLYNSLRFPCAKRLVRKCLSLETELSTSHMNPKFLEGRELGKLLDH